MSVKDITPSEYYTNSVTRDLADRLLALAGLPAHDVALIEKTATGWRFKVYESNEDGKRYLDLNDEVAHHWVDLEVAA